MGDTTDGKPPLPYGWIVKCSKSYPDRVYYFNINTGASTWEFPDLIEDYVCSSGPVSPPILSATSLHPGPIVSSPSAKQVVVDAVFSPEFSDIEYSSRGSSTSHGSPLKLPKTPRKYQAQDTGSGTCRRMSDTSVQFYKGNSGAFSISKNLVIPLSISTNTGTTSKILKSPNGLFSRSNLNRVRFSGDNAAQANISSVSQNIPSNSNAVVGSHSSLTTPRSSLVNTSLHTRTLHTEQSKSSSKLTTMTLSSGAVHASTVTPHGGTKAGLSTGSISASKPDSHSISKHSGASTSRKNSSTCTSVNPSNSFHDRQRKLSRYSAEDIKLSQDELAKQPQGNSETPKNIKHSSTSRSHKQASVANTSTLQSGSDSKVTTGKRKLFNESHNDRKLSKPNLCSTDKRKISTELSRKDNNLTANLGNKDKHNTVSIDRRKSYNENENYNNNNNVIDTSRGTVKRKSSDMCRDAKRPDVSSSSDNYDKRKVIKSLHSAALSRNVMVKNSLNKKYDKTPANDELIVCAQVDTIESQTNEPLPKRRKHFSYSNTSNGNGSDDRASLTFDKPFIGDMGKLLRVQSWIDNIDEQAGSDSPSQAYYNATLLTKEADKRVVNYECGNSGTSGYSSMTRVSSPPSNFIKTERGWPGQSRPSDVSAREVTEMEVDDIELPEANFICQQEEDMVIDVVLTEVREQMKTCPDKVVGALTASITETAPPILDIATPVCTQKRLYIVIDTNILISELSFLEDLKDHDVQGYGKAILYIPWIVLQELDSLKDHTKRGTPITLSLSTQHKARNAVRFLKSYFISKHPRVVGQTPKKCQEAAKSFKSTCNDDTILQACLQCQQLRAGSEVMLLTNDNNLINKSVVCGVDAYNKSDVMAALKKLKCKQSPSAVSPTAPKAAHTSVPPSHPTPSTTHHSNTTSSNQRAGCTATPTSAVATPATQSSTSQLHRDTPLSSKTKQSQPPVVIRTPVPQTPTTASIPHTPQTPVCRYTLDQLIDDMYGKMKKVLREALGKVLETEMELVYTDIWLEIVYRKPPWSLKDILESITKHWIAVFGHVFRRCLKQNVESLLKSFIDVKVPSVGNLANAAFDALELLQSSVTRNKYGQTMVHIRDCVRCLHELCVNIKNNNKTVESIISLESYLQKQLASQNPTGCDTRVKNVPPFQSPVAAQSTSEEVHPQTGTQEVHPQTGAQEVTQQTVAQEVTQQIGAQEFTHQIATITQGNGDRSMLGTGILAAGRLQKVWQHVFKCCDELQNVVNNRERSSGTLGQIESLLTLLVPILKDIRVCYNRVLQLPMEQLPNNPHLFIQFTTLCNNFFPGIQVVDDMAPVPAEDFLALFCSPEQRLALNQFLVQLDEMIHHIYKCIQVLDPGDG